MKNPLPGRNTRPLLVAIVGGSGSGKTWLAEKLQRALGSDAMRVSLDDFYRDRSRLPVLRRERVNFDHPRAIDWPSVEQALRTLQSGRAVHLPRYNFKTHSRIPSETVVRPGRVVLVDGLWLLRRPAIRRLFDLKIFMECAARTRLKRRLKRDLRLRGRTATSVRRQFQETVNPMHTRFVAPQKRWADLVFGSAFTDRDAETLADQLSAERFPWRARTPDRKAKKRNAAPINGAMTPPSNRRLFLPHHS